MRDYGMLTMLCLGVLYITGCSGRPVEGALSKSDDWRAVVLDAIPRLRAVELPLDMHMLSERAREEEGAIDRIPLSDEVVMAFEAYSPVGLLGNNPERGARLARQFSAYCTSEGETLLVYNFVNVGYRGCSVYADRWRREIVMDTECTSLGVFESSAPCP